jgi:hypothetical protein
MGGIELKTQPIVFDWFFGHLVLLGTRKTTRICCAAIRFSNAEYLAVFCLIISQPSVAF